LASAETVTRVSETGVPDADHEGRGRVRRETTRGRHERDRACSGFIEIKHDGWPIAARRQDGRVKRGTGGRVWWWLMCTASSPRRSITARAISYRHQRRLAATIVLDFARVPDRAKTFLVLQSSLAAPFSH
jgi:hypothetical protein